jgi:hypothetical protein
MANVIEIRRASSLRLRQIVGVGDRKPFEQWLNCDPGAKAKFRVRVRDLGRIPRVEWHTKQFRYLRGYTAGLAEIKWKWAGREWRALGYFDIEDSFVVVMGCTHAESYDPRNCLETAERRALEAQRREWRIINYEP